MQAGTQPDTDLLHGLVQRLRTVDGRAGTLEGRQGAVAGALDQGAAEQADPFQGELIVAVEQRAPLHIAQLGGQRGRVDDVGEQDGQERTFGLVPPAPSGEELLDVGEHEVRISELGHLVASRNLDEARVLHPVVPSIGCD